MNTIFDTYKPEGYGTVTPYIISNDAKTLISFLKNAFYAEVLNLTEVDDKIRNCILKIGDSCFMVSQSNDKMKNMTTSFYIYTSDVESLHPNALKHKGVEEFPPQDMPYEDRQSGIKDPTGNYWWISKRLVEKDY